MEWDELVNVAAGLSLEEWEEFLRRTCELRKLPNDKKEKPMEKQKMSWGDIWT